ncbi:hypothetical protein H257_15374 [Aphanomyces astaci]|uniref:BED-type domain-containing protein n=1 Tax=Aphanomyces astaci TaxID=112090 RepID=W4FQ50_APHAT|nr:hypothetical protein H257_15374 [Aphanomyces astaci]ETV68813.1 hypothetical protein H257_15374 [Aphanomyces astaci]|eukprot:XP_009841767.1 hypothetical protein H257_15374 [Aphanomyces astaci]
MSTFLSGKSTAPKFSPEQCSRYFFSAITESNDETTGRWRCTLCQRTYTQQEDRGYTNLLAHVKASHSNYATLMREAPAAAQSTNTRLWVSDRVKGRFGWFSWIVEEGLPLTFCEKPSTRRFTNLPIISHVTLRDNILRLTEVVEKKISKEIPDRFGIIFDGWTHNSEHYLVVFTKRMESLCSLSLAPIIHEPDDDHSAKTHYTAIKSVLAMFKETIMQCVFLVGDNCSVNKKLAKLMSAYTQQHEDELAKIQQLMIKLRTLNQASKLLFRTELRPILRQDTRWSSTFAMLQRFFKLREHLDHEDDTILEILPTLGETKKLKCLLEDLKKVESVSKRVQSTDATMWEVRTLFDALVLDFPSFEHYIEKLAVAALRSNYGADDASDEDAAFALKRVRLADENDTYVLLDAATLFLKCNRSYWDVRCAEVVAPTMSSFVSLFVETRWDVRQPRVAQSQMSCHHRVPVAVAAGSVLDIRKDKKYKCSEDIGGVSLAMYSFDTAWLEQSVQLLLFSKVTLRR